MYTCRPRTSSKQLLGRFSPSSANARMLFAIFLKAEGGDFRPFFFLAVINILFRTLLPLLSSLSVFGKDTKLIYRHYATLYFVFAVDQAESELGILDLIHVFVEVLDKCFENVCELDLIFHVDRVHYILDEIVMGGMVLETSVGEVMEAVSEMNKLENTTRALGVKA